MQQDAPTTFQIHRTAIESEIAPGHFLGAHFLLTVSRPAGISGPHAEFVIGGTSALDSTAIDDQLGALGFQLDGPFGAVCANGFDSAPVVKR